MEAARIEGEAFDLRWKQIVTDALNRTGFSKRFNRAFWYGGRPIPIPKQIPLVGGKAIPNPGFANAPGKVLPKAPGTVGGALVGAAVGAHFAPLTFGASVPIGVMVGAVLGKLAAGGAKVAVSTTSDTIMKHLRSSARESSDKKIVPGTEEALWAKLREEIKVEGQAALKVLDRNIEKLKHAHSLVQPAVRTWLDSYPKGETTDQQLEKADDALKAIAEAQYYMHKVDRLSTAMKKAIDEKVGPVHELIKHSDDVVNEIRTELTTVRGTPFAPLRRGQPQG